MAQEEQYTQTQQRGAILAKRLELLNLFLLHGEGQNFGEFLQSKAFPVEDFLSELPEEYQFKDIGNRNLLDEDSVETLKEYTEELNSVYFEQYLNYIDEKEEEEPNEQVEQEEEEEAEYESAEGDDWYEAKGKRKARRTEKREEKGLPPKKTKAEKKTDRKATKAEKKDNRKNTKANIKTARETKKDEKKKLKAAVKRGDISKKDYRKGKKRARKDFRKKVGSGLGRAIGKLNKFNPAFVIMRNAFSSILLLNVLNKAYNLGRIKDEDPEKWKKILKIWNRFGGDAVSLKSKVDRGKGKRPIFGKKKSADGVEYYNQGGPTEGAAAAYITAASAIIASMAGVIASFKKDKGEPSVAEENPDLPAGEPLDPDMQKEIDDILAGKDKDEDDEGSEDGFAGFISKYKWWLIGGGGALTALALWLGLRKKA